MFGGAPETIVFNPDPIFGVSWGAGDSIVFGQANRGLASVPAGGGDSEPLTSVDREREEFSHSWPSVLPDGRAVVFVIFSAGDVGVAGDELAVLSLETGDVTRLGLSGTFPQYVPTGHLVYVNADGTLWAAPFDVDQLAVTGDPVPVIEGVRLLDPGRAFVSFSDTGSLLYAKGPVGDSSVRSVVWVDRDGNTTPVRDDRQPLAGGNPRLSPDGEQLAFQRGGDIWVRDLTRQVERRLTEGGGNLWPTWSPDGSAVTFNSSRRMGFWDLYSRPADLSGSVDTLVETENNSLIPGSWSPDGRTLVYYEMDPQTQRNLWVLSENGETMPFLATEFNERAPRLSPDGRWVTYVSDHSGESQVYVRAFPDGDSVFPASRGPGTEPIWSRDGRELFYRDGTRMISVAVESGELFSVGAITELFEGNYVVDEFSGTPVYDVSLDGQRFLMAVDVEPPEVTSLILVQNWFEELKRLVPTP